MTYQRLPAVLALTALGCAAELPASGPTSIDDPESVADEPRPSPGARSTPQPTEPTPAAGSPAPADASPPGESPTTADGASSGPRPDARPADALGDAALAQLSCEQAKFCDGFEGYQLGSIPGGLWRPSITSGAKLAVDTSRAFGGVQSVRMTVPTGASKGARLLLTKPLPFTGNVMYGRMMIWLKEMPPSEVHWMNVTSSGRLPTGESASLFVGGMQKRLLPTYSPPDCWKDTNVPYPTGRWFCMQWQFDGSPDGNGGTRDETRVWFDGKLVATAVKTGSNCVGGNQPWRSPRFDNVILGWIHAQSSPIPIEMWMDDVAIADKPVACPAPR